MRRMLALAAILAAPLGAVGAQAAPLLVGSGTLTLEIAGLPPITAFFHDYAATHTVAPGAFPIPAAPFAGAPLVYAPGSLDGHALELSLLSRASGFFSLSGGPGGGLGGVNPIVGALRITLPVFGGAEVPLSVIGQGGSFVNTVGNNTLTLEGAPWTTGVAVVTGVTTASGQVITLTRTGLAIFDEIPSGFPGTTLTLSGSGADPLHNFLRLVAPMPIVVNGTRVPGVATLEMFVLGQVLVPEPNITSLVLLGFGLAALMAARRRI